MGFFWRKKVQEPPMWHVPEYDGEWEGTANPVPPPDDPPDGMAPLPPKRRRFRWFRWGFMALSLLFLFTIIWLIVTAPLGRALEPLDDPAMLFVSVEGQPIARHGQIKDEPVDVAQLPAHVSGAFVAIEDKRFRQHWGVDPVGIGRAAWTNAQAGGIRQGGSTITQQLAKTSFLSSERSMKRKAQEAIIALWLEGWLTKDEILSRYLSSIYFGDGVYGLRAASRHYFDAEPENLQLGQAAMLAGMVKAPSRLAPTRNLEGARERSKLVLAAMAEQQMISEEQRAAARMARPVGQGARVPTGTYFADWVSPYAAQMVGADYGLATVPTTLDADLQRLAVRSVINAPIGNAQIGFVAMRPTGEVVAMVGGRSYKKSPFNRATQAKRQPGSAFKTIVYLAALRSGWSPDDIIEDAPVSIDGWSPSNSDGKFRGPITLREAFARSSNAATVRLAERVGRDRIIRTARELGITSELTDSPSLALGTSGIPLIELTAAYAAIYSGRYPVDVTGLAADRDSDDIGRLLASQARMDSDEVWAPMLDLLYAATNNGTGRRAALRTPTFGKTGTTQENRDAVYIGFAGNLVVGVWVGHDDNASLGNISGGNAPAQVFRNFMAGALQVDGARGPRLPRRFGAPPPPPPRLPPVNDKDNPLEKIVREIEKIFS
ncbi:transglycosylase domain-containing protein [Sphingomicrobium marinum]|uniref:transglycosylase domain-containing protein n=1 Tax=Sphingomicrobium marinum TaxID=1227950 RepID=UPI0022405B9A|nr:transglycosylase domain-containing protein [Sphingomicrobium marinum]